MAVVLDSFKHFRDGPFADLIVRTRRRSNGRRTFNLHRLIVCPQSTKIDEICRAPENLNALTAKYTVPKKSDPKIFEKLVQFWYTGNYQDEDHYPPLTDVPEPAWKMSLRELQDALAPSGESAGTHAILAFPEEEGGDESGEEDREEGEVGEEEGEVGEEEGDGKEQEEGSDYEGMDDDESETSDEADEIDDIEMGDLAREPSNDQDTAELNGVPTALTTSLRVFIMASHFGVPALKLVAKDRFYRCVERKLVTGLDSPEFLACVDEIYTDSDSADDLAPIKEIVVTFIHTILDTEDGKKFMPTIAKHTSLAVELLKFTLKAQRNWLRGIRV